ncbi:PilZ domain-containing protein [Butyrivibrio proteoclasticus]|uniref:PilZ domain-containing protein n=1 Tax=Butyrivibrio proteoclasticus TaxID=43305 RepID=A0A1I5WXF3_9FIRM|nr:PilZ domain-containing protein [Butyrivibrio proteoclasticus]SFQ24422.1 PilZ domain-containing protein [Butyrivibrio proteoclasticus]
MNVNDIANGSEIKIYAAIDGHSIVLMTEAIFGVTAGLLVKPMEYFGKYMQFLEPSQIQVLNKRDGRVYRFMSTTITPVKTRYGYYHLIRASSKLEPENSRKAERFYIEKLGLMSINGNNLALKNCLIHDISLRGISLILDKNTNLKPGDKLNVMFRYGATLHNYEISTVVVRNFEIQGKKAVGCSISNLNVDLIGLLSAKRNEKHTAVAENPEINLNPDISQAQQIQEVEEDLAKEISPSEKKSLNITSNGTNPFDPSNLEHITDKSLRQKKKEEKMAQQARDIENLLDLRDI